VIVACEKIDLGQFERCFRLFYLGLDKLELGAHLLDGRLCLIDTRALRRLLADLCLIYLGRGLLIFGKRAFVSGFGHLEIALSNDAFARQSFLLVKDERASSLSAFRLFKLPWALETPAF